MINKENVLNKIKETDKISEKVLLIKLYEYYKNNSENKNIEKKDVTILDIKIAYENIKSNLDISLKHNNKINNYIRNNFEILQTYINNFEISNKDCLNDTLELITHLELMMGLSVSFPKYVTYCLDKKLKRDANGYSKNIKKN